MFADRITLQDAGSADEHYDSFQTGSNSTTRRVATKPLDEPKTLQIAHTVLVGNNPRVDTVVGISRLIKDADEVTIGTSRVQVTLRYTTGQATAAIIQEDVAQLVEFLSESNVTKLLNQEH